MFNIAQFAAEKALERQKKLLKDGATGLESSVDSSSAPSRKLMINNNWVEKGETS